MAKRQESVEEEKVEKDEKDENSYKGTFISVMLLGGFLIVTWVGVWILYLIR